MIIEIIQVSVEDKGKYKKADVIYKTSEGKVTNKVVVSFGVSESVFKKLQEAKNGTSYEVTTQKNDKGYWDWTDISEATKEAQITMATKPTGNTSPKSTYETAEERALRQVLIVRQSSLSNAVAFFALNPKKVPAPQEVLEIATMFEEYVFGKRQIPTIENLENDII